MCIINLLLYDCALCIIVMFEYWLCFSEIEVTCFCLSVLLYAGYRSIIIILSLAAGKKVDKLFLVMSKIMSMHG